MKINEVEKLLGVTKANLRFYEKEGLLDPARTEKGYRDYSEEDIARLKQIIILRKLGIPVQQIANILDGALPLQEAIDQNILNLQEELKKLTGSLSLCRQLKDEQVETLDADRYWDMLREKEEQGYAFQSLVSDYIDFLGSTLFLPSYWIPQEQWHNPLGILKYIIGWSLAIAVGYILVGKSFLGTLSSGVRNRIMGILIWGIALLPLYLLARMNPKARDFLEKWLPVFWLVLTALLAVFLLSLPFFKAYS